MCVSGYVRARPFSVNRLVHITGLSDCQLSMVGGRYLVCVCYSEASLVADFITS